ncbi:hypothetical protein [Streptomyces sp. 4N124]|uniref:hypothetical protein n=1 Tax=Streptomyces sp. 4N124 TaxID=3457420 RepID=UPI003FD00A76
MVAVLTIVVIIVVSVGDATKLTRMPATPDAPAAFRPTLSAAAPTPSEPAPIRLSGKGQQATETFTVTDGLAVFHSTCSGCEANFIVELLDSSGQLKDLLVNTIGAYDGSRAQGLSAGRYRLSMQADAAWTVTITQPRHESADSLPHMYQGKGDQVEGPFTADHAATLRGEHHGQENFAVTVLDTDGDLQDLAFNEIGTFRGSTVTQMISDGPYYLNITADGTWTLHVSRP